MEGEDDTALGVSVRVILLPACPALGKHAKARHRKPLVWSTLHELHSGIAEYTSHNALAVVAHGPPLYRGGGKHAALTTSRLLPVGYP